MLASRVEKKIAKFNSLKETEGKSFYMRKPSFVGQSQCASASNTFLMQPAGSHEKEALHFPPMDGGDVTERA